MTTAAEIKELRYLAEGERAATRTAWVRELRASLPPQKPL